MVGISLNRGAVQRWILSQSERSGISRQCMKMAGADSLDRYCVLSHDACKLKIKTIKAMNIRIRL